jgi:hypothetical protein
VWEILLSGEEIKRNLSVSRSRPLNIKHYMHKAHGFVVRKFKTADERCYWCLVTIIFTSQLQGVRFTTEGLQMQAT